MERGFEYFKSEYFKISNIDLSNYHKEQLERRVRNFLSNFFSLDKNNDDIFVLAIKQLKIDEKFKIDIFDALTINHSYFFRNKFQWDILTDYIKGMKKNNLKIWSAGCSSGEEAYTMTMILKNEFPTMKFDIFASDIDKKILQKAKKGEYDKFSLEREIPDEYLHKYFTQEDGRFFVTDEIKKCVRFGEFNLLDKPKEDNFDIVICRNVLIYFSNEGKSVVFKNFSNVLKENGILFLGPTEQFFDFEDYDYKLLKPSFYQKKKEEK